MEITKSTKKEDILKLGKECKKCGKCCSFGAGFAQNDELSKIAKHLKISTEKLKKEYFDEKNVFNKKVYEPKLKKEDGMPFGPCVFMKNRICTIHEVKPFHCRVGNCNKFGEKISEWYTVNYLVNKDDPESIRQWSARVDVKSTIIGATPLEIISDKEKLRKILEYEIM
jgi:Fe-S-cluster containining protein